MSDAGPTEQGLLRLSLILALFFAAVTVAFGLYSGSKSILFDGAYTIVEAGMTGVSLVTARLIARGDDQSFQYGYWHLEPLVSLLNSLIVAFACIYGLLDGLNGLRTGGRAMDFGEAVIFYAIAGSLYLAIYLYLRRSGRRLGSQLLDLDARGWMIGAILAAALGFGFLLGGAISATSAARLAPYVDPAILILVSLCLLPLPIRSIVTVGREILQIAPGDLDDHVHQLAERIAAEYRFRRFDTHVRRAGRQRFVEIGFVAPSAKEQITYRDLDLIRMRITEALGGTNPGCWLTVNFTAEERWI